jgi:hypothetical protein
MVSSSSLIIPSEVHLDSLEIHGLDMWILRGETRYARRILVQNFWKRPLAKSRRRWELKLSGILGNRL